MNSDASQDAAALFAGPGDVRALARSLDWSNSPLGLTTSWSPAIRTMVRSMFDSPFPICLWAGPQYALVYNDAYRRILVAKHPTALGQPGSIVWAEIWDELRPQFDGVRQRGETVYFEDAPFVMARLDGGGTETAWFNYSLSPLRDEDGSTVAVLNITPETSSRVLLQRRLDEEQAALAASEERLRLQVVAAQADAERVQLALSAGAIIGTWFWDLPADRFTVDEAFAATFGLDPTLGREGMPLAQIVATVHPDDQAGLAEAINEAIARGGRYAHQYRVRRHDGRYHWLEANGHVEHADDGTPLRFPGVLLDVAARRHDAAFGELNERLRSLVTPGEMAAAATETVGQVLNLSRVVYGDIDAAGERITLGPNWLAEGQQSIDGVVEFSAFGSFNDDLRRGEDVVISDVKTDPRTAAHAENFEPVDIGSLVNLPLMEHGRLKVVFCLNQSGPHAWSAEELNFARRVMDRTEAEIARRQAETTLQDMNLSLEQQVADRTQERNKIWQTSRDMLAVSDEAGVLLSVNPTWTETLGWSAHELVGRTSEWLEHPDDRAKTRAEIGRLAEGATTLFFENRFRTRDGDYRTLTWNAVPEGNRFYCVARDVTADREQASALLQAENALRQSQKMEAVGQLTGGLAHDFNNLLAVVTGNLELMALRLGKGKFDDLGRFMASAQAASKRATALTHRLLAFSRRQTLDPKAIGINDLVEGMRELVNRTVGPEITVEFIGSPALWTTFVDPNQLENALLNLCINARDAMPDGGRLTVETSNQDLGSGIAATRDLPPGEYVALSVSDTGTGMSPDLIARVFEPFFTTKPTGQGTGLGLSMVYGFARQSDGQVRIHSEVGHGTNVTIYLPRSDKAVVADRMETVARPQQAERGQMVLVVDDEAPIRMLINDVLRDLGYGIIEAEDGPAALKILQGGERIDLLVTDVGMPGMNGRQLADAARVSRPDLKTLFITGYAEASIVSHGHLDAGMAIITKPFALDVLANRVRAMIEASAALHDTA